jgi:hypothetical protein
MKCFTLDVTAESEDKDGEKEERICNVFSFRMPIIASAN